MDPLIEKLREAKIKELGNYDSGAAKYEIINKVNEIIDWINEENKEREKEFQDSLD